MIPTPVPTTMRVPAFQNLYPNQIFCMIYSNLTNVHHKSYFRLQCLHADNFGGNIAYAITKIEGEVIWKWTSIRRYVTYCFQCKNYYVYIPRYFALPPCTRNSCELEVISDLNDISPGVFMV